MDFLIIKEKPLKSGIVSIEPDYDVSRSEDIMIKGGDFYAVWVPDKGMWSTDRYEARRLIDEALWTYRDNRKNTGDVVVVKTLSDFTNNCWTVFQKYVKSLPDNFVLLDDKLTFQNTTVKKTDYVSKRLPYSLEKGPHDAYDELIDTLYSPEERAKIEWAIGSIVAGDSVDIQKFLVLYGKAGSGKSTVLNIVEKLFTGYITAFDAKSLTSNNNAFSTEVFRDNPLVAIQHDGDLSNIEDNTKINSIVSHERMPMNTKYEKTYTDKTRCFLFMATNKPVKITDAKSGVIRRLIDVQPTGNLIPSKKYQALMAKIDFERGAIAYHCREVYKNMGKNYYANYTPIEMMYRTDPFFNFVEANYEMFKIEDGITLSRAYDMYIEYCDGALIKHRLTKFVFREELKSYFREYLERTRIEGEQLRNYYHGFLKEKFLVDSNKKREEESHPFSLVMDKTESIFDEEYADCPAQYANEQDKPVKSWKNVTTTLKDIDTKKVHYVKVPDNHIVIDFDLKDENGNKSLEKNLEAASKWPSTYSEFSKSGSGIHLHYIYDGDITKLSRIYEPNIEIKIFNGGSSLRRKLTYCNNVPVAKINSGLPLDDKKKVINKAVAETDKTLHEKIHKILEKKYEGVPSTISGIMLIQKILDESYASGVSYDVDDLFGMIVAFAGGSTNHSAECLDIAQHLKLRSKDREDQDAASVWDEEDSQRTYSDPTLVFFDIEVFPNLLLVCWKEEGATVVNRWFNPKPSDVEKLFKRKLVGFNNLKYDNIILYACYLGKSNYEMYLLSKDLIGGGKNPYGHVAKNISYTDVFDYSSEKKSLKKFEIDMERSGNKKVRHKESRFNWNEPLDEIYWPELAEYCENDVIATEELHNTEARKADFSARLMLADLAGTTPNESTNTLTGMILFGNDQHPELVYTDMSKEFPGYSYVPEHFEYDMEGKRTYRKAQNIYLGEDVGFGGLVRAEPGMYGRTVTFDVASMHPSSIIQLNLFGKYTSRFKDLVQARIYIKHRDYEAAKTLFDGKLAPYLGDDSQAKALSKALKIAINSVYGLTSASFQNRFKDPRNVNNIVALRGALFMMNLQREVTNRGGKVIHIKTDSIKIVDPCKELSDFVFEYGRKYGYEFEIEHIFDRICLINESVYIGKLADDDPSEPETWTATGERFAVPYVFKTLFSKEPIAYDDLCEVKSVTTTMYLDMNENLPEGEHSYEFIGKVGLFCPILPGRNGGKLMRESDGKYSAVVGTKGYRWLESDTVRALHKEQDIDYGHFNGLVTEAVEKISQFGDFERFVSGDPLPIEDLPPWVCPLGNPDNESCFTCQFYDGRTCTRNSESADIANKER